MKVVVNTSPLIALNRIGCLHLLPSLFGHVIRPQSVADEIQAGRLQYGAADSLLEEDWLETVEDPPEMVLRRELGAGETAAIALAVKLRSDLILLDDLAARNVASELGLAVSGTLGVLVASAKRGLLTDVEKPLKDLCSAGFHISDSLMQVVRRSSTV